MKLLVQSDLHFEHAAEPSWHELPQVEGVDALVLAGDIASREGLRAALTRACTQYPQVIYTAGNHEHWGTDPEGVMSTLREIERDCSNLHVLAPGRMSKVRGITFVGATGWGHPRARPLLGLDFRWMREPWRWMADTSEVHWAWLDAAARTADVVVTHMVPTRKGIAPKYASYSSNWYFCAEQDELVQACGAPLWICGHTHEPFDVRVGQTRVVCNPRGYPYENNQANAKFNPRFVVEAEPRAKESSPK